MRNIHPILPERGSLGSRLLLPIILLTFPLIVIGNDDPAEGRRKLLPAPKTCRQHCFSVPSFSPENLGSTLRDFLSEPMMPIRRMGA